MMTGRSTPGHRLGARHPLVSPGAGAPVIKRLQRIPLCGTDESRGVIIRTFPLSLQLFFLKPGEKEQKEGDEKGNNNPR